MVKLKLPLDAVSNILQAHMLHGDMCTNFEAAYIF